MAWPLPGTRRLRLASILLLAALLGPGTWWRSEVLSSAPHSFSLERVALPSGDADTDPRLTAESAWEIVSDDPFFGGFSALAARADERLQAFSDRGSGVTFTAPGEGDPDPVFSSYELGPRQPRLYPDIESHAADPATGRAWLGYESANGIRSLAADGTAGELVRPRAMRRWPANGGAEAMAWLPGRGLLVLREVGGIALLFPGDPTREDVRPQRFRYRQPEGYSVTDMASLPDGRLMILMRALALEWPPYATRIFLADPPDPGAPEDWQWEEVEGAGSLLPRDNYEGLAVSPREDGTLTVWLVSDDNMAASQRSLLVRLRWDPASADSGQ